ncbi:MAG: hypothetical protein J6J42_13290 [Lachnospiraceae bacterium]|nr:hypothetical protein [Lachnospiraceae bacterium]
MKQIYNFEAKNPPVLSESSLQEELEKRRLNRQTTMATAAGILIQLALLLLSVFLLNYSVLLATVCAAYVIISATGSTVIAILMHSKHKKHALGIF